MLLDQVNPCNYSRNLYIAILLHLKYSYENLIPNSAPNRMLDFSIFL